MRQQSCCDLGLRQQGTCGQGLPLAASWGLVLRALHPGSGNSIRVLLVSIYKLCRFFAMSSSERASVPESMSQACLWSGSGSRAGAACNHREVSPGVSTDVQVALDRILPDLHLAISSMKQAADPEDLRKGITEIFQLVEEAWVMPTLGRDVAKALCDVIRLEGGLDLLLNLLQATELETKCQASQLLEQIPSAQGPRHPSLLLQTVMSSGLQAPGAGRRVIHTNG